MITLEEILSAKRKRLTESKKNKDMSQIRQEATATSYVRRDFKVALSKNERIALIAEIKLASPSHGSLTNRTHRDLAEVYRDSNADAISVLTEQDYFMGHINYISEVRQIAGQPILRKDFIFDEYQVYETVLAQADAFLLIASILSEEELKSLMNLGKQFGLMALVEVHNEEELKKSLNAGAEIIGINNRNLSTMKIDISTTERLASLVPPEVILVSESGISLPEDVRRVREVGARAVLIGSSIVKALNPIEKINELKNI